MHIEVEMDDNEDEILWGMDFVASPKRARMVTNDKRTPAFEDVQPGVLTYANDMVSGIGFRMQCNPAPWVVTISALEGAKLVVKI